MPDSKKANASLSSISHDLKSPLTGIRMMSHLLLEKKVGPLNEQQERMLQSIVTDAERLLTTVNKYLIAEEAESESDAPPNS